MDKKTQRLELLKKIDEIRMRLNAATPGKWVHSGQQGHNEIGPSAGGGWAQPTFEIDARGNQNVHNDVDFLLHAKDDIEFLLSLVQHNDKI